jgi:EF-P beta-lysylation protein EpmB
MQPPLWRKIQRNNFTKLELLLDFLELSQESRKEILNKPNFPLNLPLRLAQKIEKNNLDDPLFRQFVPLKKEIEETVGFTKEPLEDQRFKKTDKLLQKYHGRALLISTGACAMHCRYCFRQNFPYESTRLGFDEEIAHIEKDTTLTEIILSGGDPLSLSDEVLGSLLKKLDTIPHIKRIRFHTRFPIGIPERIDNSFLETLDLKKQIIFVVHINHPKELDEDIKEALKKIQRKAIPVLNQSVLLKGVNDDEETLLQLSEELISIGVIPYYLHALDPVQGAFHFALPENRGFELIDYVERNLSGFGVPRFVREEPGKLSKTRLQEK